MYCKSKPSNWTLQWAGNDSQLFKPSSLLSDAFENNVGCVEPVLERGYCDLLGVNPWTSLKLVKSSIHQLDYLSKLTSLGTNQCDQIDWMFKAFVELVKNNIVPEVYNLLPSKWVYCRENECCGFLSIDCLALNVENPVFPELYKLPRVYQEDDLARKLFIRYVFKLCYLNNKNFELLILEGII